MYCPRLLHRVALADRLVEHVGSEGVKTFTTRCCKPLDFVAAVFKIERELQGKVSKSRG
jgi:hypothetical protein